MFGECTELHGTAPHPQEAGIQIALFSLSPSNQATEDQARLAFVIESNNPCVCYADEQRMSVPFIPGIA